MLIRSQDKYSLTDSLDIDISKRRPRTDGEYVGEDIYTRNGVFLGHYSTEEKAIKVLDMIQEEYLDTTNIYQGDYVTECLPRAAVFQMPQDDEVYI